MLLGVSAQVSASAPQEMMQRPKRSMNAVPPTLAALAVKSTKDLTLLNVLKLNAGLFPRDAESRSAT